MSEYKKIKHGVIKQISADRIEYDDEYSTSRYAHLTQEREQLTTLRAAKMMQYQLLSTMPHAKYLDVGFGLGDMLQRMNDCAMRTYGTDLVDTHIPKCSTFVDWSQVLKDKWDIVSFYDSLEHLDDLDFLQTLNAKMLVVTVPWFNSKRQDFNTWKHKRDGEHLYSFPNDSLTLTLRDLSWYVYHKCHIEDVVRRPETKGEPNTLTVFAIRA